MKKKTILLTAVLVIFAGLNLRAQSSYTNALGIRIGGASGITFKHHLNSTTAVEGILNAGLFSRGIMLTCLYEKNQTVFNDAQFQFFYGAGAHLGSYSSGNYKRYPYDAKAYPDRFISLGLDAIIGLEWQVPTIPFSVSADLKPVIELVNPAQPFLDGALSIRYIF